jgi:carbon monoxide dehydrogenase subunit G
MNKIEQSLIIEAPPQAIWHILGDLTQAPAYIPGIVQARVEGSQRICTVTA